MDNIEIAPGKYNKKLSPYLRMDRPLALRDLCSLCILPITPLKTALVQLHDYRLVIPLLALVAVVH